MFIGHFAVALAAEKLARRVSRATRGGSLIAFAVLMLTVAVSRGAEVPSDASYITAVEKVRRQRVERLTKPDGWLSLIGLHFLQRGENSVGRDPGNTIVLAAGPAHLGTVVLGEDGRATITLNPAADARVDGRQVLAAKLEENTGSGATVVTAGTMSFFLIERGGRKALRVKDSEADRRVHFQGLDYFPIDPAWRIEARWVPFERPRQISITNILGQEAPALVPGKAVFEKDGRMMELLPLIEGEDEPLFFVFADLTSGKTTYAAARFVYAEAPENGRLVLDFNEAVNPPCAFTPFATCPLPPKENRLPIAVTAGEKKYRGEHE